MSRVLAWIPSFPVVFPAFDAFLPKPLLDPAS